MRHDNPFAKFGGELKIGQKRYLKNAEICYTLYNKGMKQGDIASTLGYSKPWVSKILSDYNEYLNEKSAKPLPEKIVEKQKEKELIRVSDLGCIAYMIYLGISNVEMSLNKEGRADSVYEQTEDFQKALDEYWAGKAVCDPKYYAQAIRRAKHSVFTFMNSSVAAEY